MTAVSRPGVLSESLRSHSRARGQRNANGGIVTLAYQQFDEWHDAGLRSSILLLDLHHSTAHHARAAMFRALISVRRQDEAGALHELLEAERRFCVSNDPLVGYEVGLTAGHIFLEIGATDDALADLEASWAGLALLPATHLHMRCAYLLAEAWSRLGRWHEADRWWEQARVISLQTSAPTLVARWEINRFAMYIRESAALRSIGDREGAADLARSACRGLDALAEADESGLPAHTRALRVLRHGEALRLAGQNDAARFELERLVSGPGALWPREVVAEAHRLLARLAVERSDLHSASAHCEQGLDAARSDRHRHLRAALLGLAAWICCERGQVASSTVHLRELLDLRNRIEMMDALRGHHVRVLSQRIQASAARRRAILAAGPAACRRALRSEERLVGTCSQ